MALRLRRGTDAERITIIPLEGELIYTTDTEKVYVGDGTTAGGNLISTFEISDLTDVNTSGISVGDVLKWNGAAFVPGPDDNSGGAGIVEGSTYNINVDGDITGSVFGDNSSLLVDGVRGVILGDIDTDLGDIKVVNSQTINVKADDQEPILKLTSETNTGTFGNPIISVNNHHAGTYSQEITFSRSAGTADSPTAATSGDYVGSLTFRVHDGNDYTSLAAMHVVADTVTGTDDVASKIDFYTRDGAIASEYEIALTLRHKGAEFTGYVQFGSYTTTERDALTAANGMVIYNTTDNKFQGYENGAWANLI